MTKPSTPLEWALHYAKAGFEVFPADDTSKAPLVDNGFRDATTDPATISGWWQRWPTALVACRIPDDVLVLDIDPRHGGDRTITELETSYGPLPVTRTHRSGRGDNGAHIWFTRPAGVPLSTKLLDEWARKTGTGHAAGKRGWSAGIDILHHDLRYTILPPSLHPDSRRPYEWVRKGDPADMPAWLIALLTKPAAPAPPAKAPQLHGNDSIADWYSDHATWTDILAPAGWLLVDGDGDSDGSKWRHPNATATSSCSIQHGCLFVFTPNTDFDATDPGDPRGYTRFRAYATLEHAGNMGDASRAARALKDGHTAHSGPTGPSTRQTGTRGPQDTDDIPAPLEGDWETINLTELAASIRSGEHKPIMPEILAVTGTTLPLFYRQRINSLFGESGGGKTWLALAAIAETAQNGGDVMFVDYEDNAAGIAERLVLLGLDDDDIGRVDYRNPTTGIGHGIEQLDTSINYDLIVIDSTGEAMAAGGVDSNADREVAQWFALAKKLLRLPGGPAVIVLDHVPKDKDAPTSYAIGSQRKRAAVTGAAYRVDTLKEPAKGRNGKLKLTVAKDRPGNRPKGSVAAEVDVLSDERGVVLELHISDAQAATEAGVPFRPTVLMERVSRYLEGVPGASARQIEKDVSGKGTGIRTAIGVLEEEGYIKVGQHGYETRQEYREAVDNYGASPASHRVPSASRDAAKKAGMGARPRVPDIHKSGTRDALPGGTDEGGDHTPRPPVDNPADELF